MHSLLATQPLVVPSEPAALRPPLAVLCLSESWGEAEQQTLALCEGLHRAGWPVRLLVGAGSPLHERAEQLPCYPLITRRGWPGLRAAWALRRWLRREQVAVLLTTADADLQLATLLKLRTADRLQLVHRPFAAPAAGWPARLRQAVQLCAVDAWLAPLPRQARELLATTRFDARRLWVVPPVLPHLAAPMGRATPAEARRLLDLTVAGPLLGVVDCGADGPAFAVEALYRLRTEYCSDAELVIVGGPATPGATSRWNDVRQLAYQLRLGHCVHLRPMHTSGHPVLFYHALDALLLPAAPNATGLNLLAAVASGCPIVSTDLADAPDLIEPGQTGRLFPAGDVAACAQALLATLHEPATARAMARRAAGRLAQHCSPQPHCQQVEAIIQFVCRHDAPGSTTPKQVCLR